ncbi:hypothetical protein SeLEV6574_g07891 [Synchytrium endobioticum]|uniref:RING-type domain-containing protein n=1 Tax=Synchytrium endobioticum TaxID=286115 RepID=A0A507CH94_9FUNG|nr:hypothetical protein SeLEV6574_g07891 [Synchytrium endobioticum]
MPKPKILALIAVQVMLCCIHPSTAGGCRGCYGNMPGSPCAVSEHIPRDSPVRPDRGTVGHYSSSHTVRGPYTEVGSSSSGLGDVSVGYAPHREGRTYDAETAMALLMRKVALIYAVFLPNAPAFVINDAAAVLRNELPQSLDLPHTRELLNFIREKGMRLENPPMAEALRHLDDFICADCITMRQSRIAAPGTESINTYCTGCLEDVTDDDIGKILHCGHQFHPKCIDPWLMVDDKCPICGVQV